MLNAASILRLSQVKTYISISFRFVLYQQKNDAKQ
jgi:hypothetical protein